MLVGVWVSVWTSSLQKYRASHKPELRPGGLVWEMQRHEAAPMCQAAGLSPPAHPPAANLLRGTDLTCTCCQGTA